MSTEARQQSRSHEGVGVGPAGREDETCAIKGEGRTRELGRLIENEGGWVETAQSVNHN